MKSLIFAFLFMSSSVLAHGALHDQAHDLSHALRKDPKNAELYVKRGLVYLEDGQDAKAQKDFETALHLENSARAAHYFLGKLALKQAKYAQAQEHATAFLNSLNGEAGGMMRGNHLLGDSLMGSHSFVLAAKAYQAAIDHAESPSPDFYLDLARAHEQQGQSGYSAAINALASGINRLGPLPVLQNKQIELLVTVGDYDAALSKLDALILKGQGLPDLYERKGNILRAAGRQNQAQQAYQSALKALDQFTRQNTPALKTQRARLEKYSANKDSTPPKTEKSSKS